LEIWQDTIKGGLVAALCLFCAQISVADHGAAQDGPDAAQQVEAAPVRPDLVDAGLVDAGRARTPLQVGTILHNPPYVFQEPSRGIDLDIIAAVFEEMGVAATFLHAPVSRVEFLLDAGRIDAMTTFRSREDQCANSAVFSNWHDGISVRTALAGEVRELGDLAGLRVGLFPGAERVLADVIGDHVATFGSRVTIYSTPLVVRMLGHGRVDAYIGDYWAMDYVYRAADGLEEEKPYRVVTRFQPTPRRLCFRDGALRDRFNAALAAVEGRGDVKAVIARYMGADMPSGMQER
jgi:ABC-type amino acid transport substrate-binding protein